MEAAVFSLVLASLCLIIYAVVQVVKILSKHISDDISEKISTELHQICPFIHPTGVLLKLGKTKVRLLHENNIFITIKYKFSTYIQVLSSFIKALISKDFILADVPEIIFFVDLTKFRKATCNSEHCPSCNPEFVSPNLPPPKLPKFIIKNDEARGEVKFKFDGDIYTIKLSQVTSKFTWNERPDNLKLSCKLVLTTESENPMMQQNLVDFQLKIVLKAPMGLETLEVLHSEAVFHDAAFYQKVKVVDFLIFTGLTKRLLKFLNKFKFLKLSEKDIDHVWDIFSKIRDNTFYKPQNSYFLNINDVQHF